MTIAGRRNGFSLIEILVVIVIIGIVSSVALLSLGILGDDRELQTEARRLISLVEVAQDEAVMQGRELGLELMAHSYRFVEYNPFTNQWGDLVGDATFRMRQLPEDIELELYLEGRNIMLEDEPADFDNPDMVGAAGPKETYTPHILVFSSGDITPFELHVLRSDSNQAVALRGGLTGSLELLTEDD